MALDLCGGVTRTPDDIHGIMDLRYNFTSSIECKDATDTSLVQEGGAVVWLNIHQCAVEPWLRAVVGVIDAHADRTIVCLLPARTNTSYFHSVVLRRACAVMFIRGRLRLSSFARQAPYPSMVVVFGACTERGTMRLNIGGV